MHLPYSYIVSSWKRKIFRDVTGGTGTVSSGTISVFFFLFFFLVLRRNLLIHFWNMRLAGKASQNPDRFQTTSVHFVCRVDRRRSPSNIGLSVLYRGRWFIPDRIIGMKINTGPNPPADSAHFCPQHCRQHYETSRPRPLRVYCSVPVEAHSQGTGRHTCSITIPIVLTINFIRCKIKNVV